MLNNLQLFWFTSVSSVLLNEEVQLLLHVICLFYFMTSLIIIGHLSIKTILVDPNLVRTFFGNNSFDRNYGEHPSK